MYKVIDSLECVPRTLQDFQFLLLSTRVRIRNQALYINTTYPVRCKTNLQSFGKTQDKPSIFNLQSSKKETL